MSKTIQSIFVDLISISFWSILGKIIFNNLWLGIDVGLFINLFGSATGKLLRNKHS